MAMVNVMVIFIIVNYLCLEESAILVLWLFILKCFIVHQNVRNNCVYICDVYVQDMLIAGTGTFNYNITIIFL